MKISSKYLETRSELINKIKKDNVKVLSSEQAEEIGYILGDFCWFCQETINSKRKLIFDYEHNYVYLIGSDCYFKAKGLSLVKN